MKQKISYSSLVSGLTITFFVILIAIFVLFWVFIDKPYDNVFFWILVGLFALCFCWAFGSMPYSVDADDDYVSINHPFHTRKYSISDIKSVERADANQYKAEDTRLHFHGKFKNPVIITFKDGRKEIIGTDGSGRLIDYINQRIS